MIELTVIIYSNSLMKVAQLQQKDFKMQLIMR